MIENSDVPIPKSCPNFIAMSENKADLNKFLSYEILENVLQRIVFVVSEEFTLPTDVRSLDPAILRAIHEEADTRLILQTCGQSF